MHHAYNDGVKQLKYRSSQTVEAEEALRTALAAPKQEPVAWLSRDEARLALWKAINSREFGNPTDDKLILDHLRQQGLWIGKVTSPALAAEKRHPDYVIGNHWFETAYERLCAGEAEDAILEDYELVREPRLRDLRRDAERYRWLRDKAPPDIGDMASVRDSHDPSEIDAAIDAAMEASTAPASAAADSSTAPEAKP